MFQPTAICTLGMSTQLQNRISCDLRLWIRTWSVYFIGFSSLSCILDMSSLVTMCKHSIVCKFLKQLYNCLFPTVNIMQSHRICFFQEQFIYYSERKDFNRKLNESYHFYLSKLKKDSNWQQKHTAYSDEDTRNSTQIHIQELFPPGVQIQQPQHSSHDTAATTQQPRHSSFSPFPSGRTIHKNSSEMMQCGTSSLPVNFMVSDIPRLLLLRWLTHTAHVGLGAVKGDGQRKSELSRMPHNAWGLSYTFLLLSGEMSVASARWVFFLPLHPRHETKW